MFAKFHHKIALLMTCLMMACLTLSVNAQETNLLANAGFESGFTSLSGTQPRNVATAWTPWNAPRTDSMASYQNTSPKYIAASAANAVGVVPRIRTGNDAQIYYAFYETFDGGIYQQITGLTAGTEVRFSVYSYVWSTTYDDPNVSEDPGGVAFRVGIDPTGGTDALSANVIYSTPTVAYDAYRQASVIAKAQGSTVTVFIRTSIGDPVQYSYVYLDDAVLSTTVAAPVPTSTRPPATNTVAPTATRVPPTATTVPPTSATIAASSTPLAPATAVNTSSPNVPAATNTTAPVVASSTSVPPTVGPSNTPSLPTPTQEGGLLPTATPIGLDATATAFAGGGTQPTIPANPTQGPSPVPPPTKAPEPTATPDLTVLDDFPGRIFHTVRRGDTVFDLSRLYGSSMDAIIVANGLNSNGFLSVGQNLIVPVVVVVPTPVATAVPAQPTSVPLPTTIPNPDVVPPPLGTILYQVTYGDSLNNLAARFNTTVGAIVQLNGITNPNLIFVGQRLLVPSSGLPGQVPAPVPTSYVVLPGDNLYRISLKFGRSIQAIASANNIINFNRIFVGQTLIIPQ